MDSFEAATVSEITTSSPICAVFLCLLSLVPLAFFFFVIFFFLPMSLGASTGPIADERIHILTHSFHATCMFDSVNALSLAIRNAA